MPRIGIILHDFAMGGTERIAARLATAWAATGARVTIFCGSTDGPAFSLIGRDVVVAEAEPTLARGKGSRRLLGQAAAVHFARDPVDVVFVPGNFHWPVAPALARLPAKIRPIIVAQVSASLDKPQRGSIRQAGFDLRMRWLLKDVDGIVTLSDAARGDADRIVGGGRTTSIALPALADDIGSPQTFPEQSVIFAAGRLVPEKGFADLIDAFALLDDRRSRLVIAGDGPERATLEARAVARGVAERVDFPGHVPDIRPCLDQARLFVLSSHFEGYPAVIVEALAAGRPIVATRCTPAAAALLDETSVGRTVPVGDAKAMAGAIATMLAASPPDPTALAARVQHHRIGPVARDYLDLFARLANERRG